MTMQKNISVSEISDYLRSVKDEGYKEFHSKLVPNIPSDKIIGVRIPVLRKYAKSISSDKCIGEFLKSLPHKYYEEDNLHAFLIEKIKDFDEALSETEKFLPYIDNWATCDSFFPKAFLKNPDVIKEKALLWIKSPHEYTVRYGISMFMRIFLGELFDETYMKEICKINSDKYYVKMMIAWYFATALFKQYDTAIKYLENKSLEKWVHNKAIQKAVESYRITNETKSYLKTLKY